MGKVHLVLEVDIRPVDLTAAGGAAQTKEGIPHPFQHGGEQPAVIFKLAGKDIRLLGAHFLGGGPVEPQHKGGDRELGNDLFKKLPHGDLGIKDLIIRPDDPYIHIAHGDKVFHNAAA